MRPKLPVELRARQRIAPQGPRSLFLQLEDYANFYPISDISYDGIGITTSEFKNIEIGRTFQGTVLFLGNKIDVALCLAQSSGSIAGFTINYKDPSSLLLMRELMEPLQTGATLRPIGSGNSSEGNVNLTGLLGTSFISSNVATSFLTIYYDLKEYSFEWRDGAFSQLLSKKEIEASGISHRSNHPKIDDSLLRNAYLFLLGIEWPSKNDRLRNEICAAIEKLLHTQSTLLKVVMTKTDN